MLGSYKLLPVVYNDYSEQKAEEKLEEKRSDIIWGLCWPFWLLPGQGVPLAWVHYDEK